MAKNTLGTITVRTSAETKDWFKSSFEASTANSQGEFLQNLLEKWNEEEPAQEPEVKTVTIEKELLQNEILVNLTPPQLFALRGTVLSFPDFAERQNEIIDKAKGKRPFMYFGNLCDPEFHNLWVKNTVITKSMTEKQREDAIKHNMSAFLINMFLTHIIEGNLSETTVTAESLKAFINKQATKELQAKNNLKTVSNESNS